MNKTISVIRIAILFIPAGRLAMPGAALWHVFLLRQLIGNVTIRSLGLGA